MSESPPPIKRRREPAPDVEAKTTRSPWLYCGVSRSFWYQLQTQEKVPPPIRLSGGLRFWRLSDLDKWLASLKPTYRRRQASGG